MLEPPEELLAPCELFYLEGDLVIDLIEQSYKNMASIEKCNTDKKSIMDYYKKREL